ncbi:MAG: tetratricopeptide repeat protein [Pseudomonadota bacterium]
MVSEADIATGQEATWVEQLVQSKIVQDWEAQDEPIHLKHISKRILQAGGQETGRLLGVYQQILLSGSVAADNSYAQLELRLSGLVVQFQGQLWVYNRIYAEVFNQAWVEQALSDLRPYAEALRAWLATDDSSRLLQGQALRDALTWAEGKSITEEDHRFLSASQALEESEARKALKAKTQRQLIGILGIYSIVAIGLAGWGYVAQKQASENAELAEQQKELALQAINTFTYDLVDELVQLPRTSHIITSILESNTALLDQIYVLDPDTPEALREKASNLSRMGNAWLLLGKTELALQAYQQALKVSQKLAQDDPTNVQAQRDLMISYYKLGAIHDKLQKSALAQSFYQQALAIAEVLAKKDTANAQAQQDLKVLRSLVEQCNKMP